MGRGVGGGGGGGGGGGEGTSHGTQEFLSFPVIPTGQVCEATWSRKRLCFLLFISVL